MRSETKLLKKKSNQENRQYEILEPPYTFQEHISKIIVLKNSKSDFMSWIQNYPLACDLIIK
jgi:hypothetical protein